MMEELHDAELLDDTPIGRLAVVPWGDGLAVAVMHDDEPAKTKRIIHMLGFRENPLAAIYGKRCLEQKAMSKAYAVHADHKATADAREHEDRRRDFRREIERALSKDWSGDMHETMAAMLRGKR